MLGNLLDFVYNCVFLLLDGWYVVIFYYWDLICKEVKVFIEKFYVVGIKIILLIGDL